LELRHDWGFQSAATADSITGPKERQRNSAKFSNKSTIFKVSISTVAYCYKPNY